MARKKDIDWESVKKSCPDGYTVNGGEPLDMLGITELWRVF